MRIYNRKKEGYTIAEMMIVLLVLTVIFAAFAPVITKRRLSSYKSANAIWNKHNETKGFDAYYTPSDREYTGALFLGLKPDSHGTVTTTLRPFSRVVIRSGPITSANKLQRQIQFRYGRSGDANVQNYGNFAGSWLMDRQNVLLGGAYPNIDNTPDTITARDNVAIGYQSMNAIQTSLGNTALGSYALSNNISGKYNTAIGYKAGSSITKTLYNTFIGAGAGENASGEDVSYNTVIGYRAGRSLSGGTNVFIGSRSGENATSASRNVAIGYKTLQTSSGEYNIAMGAGALKEATSGGYNVAIGYNACSEVTTGFYKTCIGANSGPHAGSTAENYLNARTDKVQRTYIGSKPKSYYGGDAVMEIHNVGGQNNKLANSPSVKSNTTTVINGNLMVRGRSFLTVGNTLINFYEVNPKGWSDSTDNAFGFWGDHSDYKVSGDQSSYAFNKNGVNLSSSDRRLKNIGTKSIAGLKELNQLKIYDYTFKNDKSKHSQIGVMAQDLQKVFPNSVFEGPDGYLRIRWDEMFFASINAIKEIDKKIVNLVNRATKVETQIAKLEQENVELKAQVNALNSRVEKLKHK